MTITKPSTTHPGRIHFSVDAALLRELGERLVGQPHIALAELVKNSYDADATQVTITFGHNTIHVVDNGHGMNQHAFEHFWMRIGTPHKQDERLSRQLKRPLTGSKGVGRLAVQFLAKRMRVRTVFREQLEQEILATVNWTEATKAGDLVSAYADCAYRTPSGPFPGNSAHGTEIVLMDLNQEWGAESLRGLAREIWFLQPPFRHVGGASEFEVSLRGHDAADKQTFEEQMKLHLDSWEARIVGKLATVANESTPGSSVGELTIDLQFGTAPIQQYQYRHLFPNVRISELEFEIRVYRHQHRQRGGVKIQDVRDYFNEWGGVHVYDAGFRLPYYGQADADWLETEYIHAHRQSVSKLLPQDLKVKDGMNNLPTRSRLFGVVHVNSQREAAFASSGDGHREHLLLQVTRDRLVENGAYASLKECVQFALHFYAMKQTERMIRQKQATMKTSAAPTEALERFSEVLEKHRGDIPSKVFKDLEKDLDAAVEARESADQEAKGRLGLLGALATAGIAALAYEHEVAKQLELLREVGNSLRTLAKNGGAMQRKLAEMGQQIDEWIERARGTRSLFAPLLDEENRSLRGRFPAKQVLQSIVEQSRPLLRGAKVETVLVDQWVRMPMAGLVEWNAIFQNVLVNAVNAMVESERKLVRVSSFKSGKKCAILVQDTGIGVDLERSKDLFEPFVRRMELGVAQRALGLGGSGLGLTIVRMVADELGCEVGFVKPESGFNTCFELSWREK